MTERHRLTRIIRLKERIRDARRGALAQAEAERHAASERVEQAEAQVVALVRGYCEAGTFDARELLHRASLVESAREHRAAMQARLTEVEAERARCAAALAEAGRDVRSLEVLEGRLLAEEKREAGRREQAMLDERGARYQRRAG
ncbi:MAG: flagellar FliJ family protein [Myxococcota bacterium]|nr:flagellar FliJ family protein [Myxococcota bacterium]